MRQWVWYALGVSSGIVASVAGRPVAKALRPVAKNTLKNSIVLRRDVERRAEEARATYNDLLAEANAEVDAAETGGEGNGEQ